MEFFPKVIAFLGPWSWWVLGLLLAAVEVFAPGTFFLWFAIAAILVGTLALAVPLSWQVQVVLFVVLAVIAALVGRRLYGRSGEPEPDRRHLNDRMNRQVGRPAVLEGPIENGTGRIRLDDTIWRADGPDLPAGTAVTIVGVKDNRFVVAPRESA